MTRPGKAKRTCGATGRQTGEPCELAAGWGIPGMTAGPCRHHGGSLPSVRKAVVRREAEAELTKQLVRLGTQPRSVDPIQAIYEVVAEDTGVADQLTRMLADADPFGSEYGAAVFTRWTEAQERKLRAAKVAVDSRLTAVQTDLAKLFGDRLVDMLENLVVALGHDPDSPEVDQAVRGVLAASYAPVRLAIDGPR